VQSHDAVTATIESQSLVDADGTTILGVLTNQSFDEVRIEYNSLVGVLFTADVYHAVIENFVLDLI
jgi:hypothetical protein